MKNIIEIIMAELSIHKKALKDAKGGMAKYMESLEDSDTFYKEASSIGAVSALKELLNKINEYSQKEDMKLCMHIQLTELEDKKDNRVVATISTKVASYDVIYRKKDSEQFLDINEIEVSGNYSAIEGKFPLNLNSIDLIKSFIVQHEEKSSHHEFGVIKTVYRPDFDKLPEEVTYELSNVWIDKGELEKELINDGVDVSFIEEIKTTELDCFPEVIDSKEYSWDEINEQFVLKGDSFVKKCFEKNNAFFVKDIEKALNFFFTNVKHNFTGLDDGDYYEAYNFSNKNERYFVVLKNNASIKVKKDDMEIVTANVNYQYGIIDVPGIKKIVTVPEDILNEYWNEIYSDVAYNSKDDGSGKGCIIVENNRYGYYANAYKIEYTWKNAEYDYLKIGNIDHEFCGTDKNFLLNIFQEKFDSINKSLASFVDYCRGSGISINSSENEVLEVSRVIQLKEGKDDTNMVSYLISSPVSNLQLKQSFEIASFVWNSIDDETISFDDIAKSVKSKFDADLNQILEEFIPNSWYLILEKIFEYKGIKFTNVSIDTFVI